MVKSRKSRKLPTTPRSRIRSALRQVWLRSRERAAAIKRERGCCEKCGVKQTRAKGKEVYLEVHHKKGIEWDRLIDLVFEFLLCNPDDLEVLCEKCHNKKHEEEDWLK